MVGDLMTFPVRAGIRVTQFALRTGLGAAAQAVTLATSVVRSLTGNDDQASPPRPAPAGGDGYNARADDTARNGGSERPAGIDPRSQATELIDEPAPAAPTPITTADELDQPPDPIAEVPTHVSEEPVLVEEVAEAGAEDGAGASLTVEEPWKGYRQLKAKEIVARLVAADASELAMIQLYESTHKQRDTVLTAVARELRRLSGNTPPS